MTAGTQGFPAGHCSEDHKTSDCLPSMHVALLCHLPPRKATQTDPAVHMIIYQTTFFMLRFWCSCAHCRHFHLRPGVSIVGAVTGPWLCSPLHSKLWCTVCSAMCYTVALLCDETRQDKRRSTQALVCRQAPVRRLSCPGPLLVGTNHYCIVRKPH